MLEGENELLINFYTYHSWKVIIVLFVINTVLIVAISGMKMN